MTERYRHQTWVESQLRALIDIGVDLAEAERSVKRVLDMLPLGADPATWIPTAEDLWIQPDGKEAIDDARADWYASEAVQGRFKRLLDAEIETNA
jgi:hypothetical protein